MQKLCRFFARNRVRKGDATGAERRKWSEERGVRHLSSCDSLPFEARKLRDRVAKGKVLSLDLACFARQKVGQKGENAAFYS